MVAMNKHVLRRLRAFRRDQRGVIALETIVIFPMVFWMLLATFVFFDAYRQNSISIKAAYTISDMLSRETQSVNTQYLENTRKLFETLTSRAQENVNLRVTVLTWDAPNLKHEVEWSKVQGAKPELTDSDVVGWKDYLPVLPNDESIVVVETWAQYNPPFNIGLQPRQIRTFVFTRMRFSPQLVWAS